MQIASEENT